MAWAYDGQDLANTLHGACWRLFLDSSSGRLKLAEAVRILRNEFVRLGKSVANAKTCEDAPAEANEILARMEVDLKLAQQKAQGSDMGKRSSEKLICRAKRNT